MAERLTGCTQARYADNLASKADELLATLPDRLAALRDKVLAGATPAASLLCGDASYAAGRAWFIDNAARFGGSGLRQPLPAPAPRGGEGARIGLAAPADVAYAARVLPAPAMTDPDAAALAMLGVQLSYGYLWNEVRVKGGAYGVRAALDGGRGTFALSSFRDPNIVRTLDSFASVREYVANEMDLSPEGLEQSVIGAIKTLDVPMRPPTAVATALMRHLGGESEDFRRVFRTRLLNLDADAVRSAASRLFSEMESAPVCVLSSREKIVAENAKTDKPLVIESLWQGA
jgi:Zn-dependent M16 (insulinase) family peptidase